MGPAEEGQDVKMMLSFITRMPGIGNVHFTNQEAINFLDHHNFLSYINTKENKQDKVHLKRKIEFKLGWEVKVKTM